MERELARFLQEKGRKESDSLSSIDVEITATDRNSHWLENHGMPPPPIKKARRTGHLQDVPKRRRRR